MTIDVGSKGLLIVGMVPALAIVAVVAGMIPLSQALWLGLVVICLLMMFFMMRDMQGGRDGRS